MRDIARDAVLRLLRRTRLYSMAALRRSSALADDGWFTSFRDHRSTDRAGNPLPWFTYPAIHFLDGRIDPSMVVFEYGSGNSTLWWAQRAGWVVAVEYDPAFLNELRGRLPSTATVKVEGDADMYVTYPTSTGAQFDIVVIDGERRDDCAAPAVDALSDRGVVILDDTERGRWPVATAHLARCGFRRLDFWGLHPMHISQSATSVFYRDGNCLGI